VKVAMATQVEVTLTLTEREAELMSALADFPLWTDQPAEVASFVTGLHEELADAGYSASPEDVDFADSTSL
jgi:hypothetical protein